MHRTALLQSLVIGGQLCAFAPGLSTTAASSSSDFDVVTGQLGYSPTNFVRVSARNDKGDPIAIQTYPLDGGARRRQSKARRSFENQVEWLGTPFPTLYWLTCPDISRSIASLERKGFVKVIESELRENEDMFQSLMDAHRDYARLRWGSLAPDDRQQLSDLSAKSTTIQRMGYMLESSGIAGSNLTLPSPTVKCLHTHYAHFRSVTTAATHNGVVNPVGARVHELLVELDPSLVL